MFARCVRYSDREGYMGNKLLSLLGYTIYDGKRNGSLQGRVEWGSYRTIAGVSRRASFVPEIYVL